jgi:hypothetical protein
VNRRRPDVAAFAFGAIFVAAAVWWLVNHSFAVDFAGFGWILAVVLIVIGVIGIWSVLRGDRRRESDRRNAERRPDDANSWRP